MSVPLLSKSILLGVLVLCPGDVTGQFTAAPSTCPGEPFTFRCTVGGDLNSVTTWKVAGIDECTLVHTHTSPAVCGPSDTFTSRPGTGFGTSATSFTSTLSGTATPTLNGTLVECFGPANNVDPGNMVGNSSLQILGPPSVPSLSCVGLSEDVSGAVNVTMNWTLGGGDSADFYLINITTTAPQIPYRGLLNITTASITLPHILTGFHADYEYNITVHGVNCRRQEGGESEPLAIRPQIAAIPRSCNITVLYNQSSRRLEFIDISWKLMPTSVDSQEACQGPRGVTRQYQIGYQIGSFKVYENVNTTACRAERCSHTYNLLNVDSIPSGYDSVSVAAMNVVGVGPARTCTAQTISTTNNLLTGEMLNMDSPNDATVLCTFLCEFNSSARCQVQYGTDATYRNLPYSAVSTDTGRAGNSVRVALREQLNSSTVYYYTVSSIVGDISVTVRGTFRTPQYMCSEEGLTDQSGTANSTRCTDRGLANSLFISGGVVCYNGTTIGSRAVYICNEDFLLMEGNEATRVCQSDANWNGSTPQCIRDGKDQVDSGIIGGVIGGVIGVVVAIIVIVIVITIWIMILGPKKRKLQEEEVDLPSPAENLHRAAEIGQMSRVTYFVESGAGVNIKDAKDRTPLHMAVKGGHMKIVDYLVENNADINITDTRGWTPLHIAAKQGHQDMVENLIGKKASMDSKDNDERTPFHMAVEGGHLGLVTYFLEKVVDIKSCGRSPLHMAVKEGHKEIVEYLVKKKADVNSKDTKGRTPLHIAVKEGHKEIVEYLVKSKADVNITDTKGWTPLHIAAKQGHQDMVEYLIGKKASINSKENDGWTPLHIAARRGHQDMVEYLIGEKASINIEDNDGRTPFHVAAEGGHLGLVTYFLEKGVDIDIKESFGWTPLHIASRQDRKKVVEYLIGKGASINIQDRIGRTPLHWAAKRCHVNIVKALLRNNADMHIKDEHGCTPIHMAAKSGDKKIVEQLVEKEADIINIKDDKKRTALCVAAEEGQLDIVKYFVGRGLNINSMDNKGRTLLFGAAKGGHKDTVKYLIECGADISLKDVLGKTPLEIANEEGYVEIVEYLKEAPEKQTLTNTQEVEETQV